MKFLVPSDFSETSKNAVRYAVNLAQQLHAGCIQVIHVVDSPEKVTASELEFERYIKGLEEPEGFEVRTKVVVGNLYETVGKYAKENGYDLIVMSTKGAKGLEKVMGSNVVRMIQNSKVPFIVVQKEIAEAPGGVKEIALPVTLQREDKAILRTVTDLAIILKAKIEIIYQEKSDEFLSAAITRNLNFTKNYFKNRNLEINVNRVAEDHNFSDAVVNIASARECDLIAVINKHEDGIKNLFGWNFDQRMLENNAHIPVLTIDAVPQEDITDVFGVGA